MYNRLTSLEELHVLSENNLNILELKSLSRLNALTLPVSSDNLCSEENFVFPKLQRYYIALNADFDGGDNWPMTRRLEINDFSDSFNAFKALFCNMEELVLRKVRGHKNIVPDIHRGPMNTLTSLDLKSCKEMECLIDTTVFNNVAFSNLENLRLFRMDCLKELCRGQAPIGFLQELKELEIERCEGLEQVFDFVLDTDSTTTSAEQDQVPFLSNIFLSLDIFYISFMILYVKMNTFLS